MNGLPRRDIGVAVSSLVLLMLLWGVQTAGWLPDGPLGTFGDDFVTTMGNRGLNREGREALSAGYYEGLINEGSRLGAMNRLVTDNRRLPASANVPDRERVETFRLYELRPNADVMDYADDRARHRLRTNEAGMADQSYSLAKPPGARRFALVGDSVTRGQGAPFQGNYEALLEAQLNAEAPAGRSYEILNFAVGSYSLMQMMDAAIERATPYEPDVYVVALTDRSVYRRWGDHLVFLLDAGIDLKYDHLRQVVREAGLQAGDSRGVAAARLAPFRLPTIQWALREL